MIIFGIDPGLRHTGFGVIWYVDNRLRYVASGTLSPPTDGDLHVRLLHIYEGLLAAMREHAPSVIAVEDIFIAKNSRTALTLGHVRGVVLLAAAHAGGELREFPSRSVKKSVVGFGAAEKKQVEAMIKILLPTASPDSEHAADALAVAITCAHHVSGVR